VADNQERKNLAKSFEIVGKLKKEKEMKVKYILVSREFSPIGWKLRDLAMRYGIASELMLFERGLDFKKLYALYAVSDAYLSTSKAEGLGLPVLEAMACGIPVVATNTGALTEVLADGRGFLMKTEYTFCDPWGNADRNIPSADSGVNFLDWIWFYKGGKEVTAVSDARMYIETLTWDIPIKQLDEAMEKLNESEI
jgi:glycosyltransferase involved in cell wall biosynthesis